MLQLKRLYRFILETFLPVFMMTFLISLFILLMQFLWRYVDELVGKGLSFKVLGEFFFYSALSLIPMALPLSILLASLMTFGNMGERLELLAMKAAGVPLIRIMRPLIIFISAMSVFSFFYQNEVNPKVQVKTYSLLIAMKQKSPELDIPEKTFYQIADFNMYVDHKNIDTGVLYDIIVYDYTNGFENATVIVADSARLDMTRDKKALFYTLWSGESFENLQKQRSSYNNVPYRRETFSYKQLLIEFDANFNRMDESFLSSQYVGKDLNELGRTADSLRVVNDSIKKLNAKALLFGTPLITANDRIEARKDTSASNLAMLTEHTTVELDTLMAKMSTDQKRQAYYSAKTSAISRKQDIQYRGFNYIDTKKSINRHELEWHRKFSLSFACLIFFFIGAPLGAIIRKGGLGTPAVLSVFLFIFYYIIDNVGYKFARDGVLPAYQGMWLSSAILVPLGVFLTYKAVKDSTILSSDTYTNLFKKLFGKRTARALTKKEVVIYTADMAKVSMHLQQLDQEVAAFLKEASRPLNFSYFNMWLKGDNFEHVAQISAHIEEVVEELLNTDEGSFFYKISEYPVLQIEKMHIVPQNKTIRIVIGFLIFPVGIVIYILALLQRRALKADLQNVLRINSEISNLIKK
ncbi:MAG: LptF/LptG family permease [Bacteroidales bacterium]